MPIVCITFPFRFLYTDITMQRKKNYIYVQLSLETFILFMFFIRFPTLFSFSHLYYIYILYSISTNKTEHFYVYLRIIECMSYVKTWTKRYNDNNSYMIINHRTCSIFQVCSFYFIFFCLLSLVFNSFSWLVVIAFFPSLLSI